jgi:DNA-binding CsgD family transcriptional regulator/tetratricopeptide (TPR) repeat protein
LPLCDPRRYTLFRRADRGGQSEGPDAKFGGEGCNTEQPMQSGRTVLVGRDPEIRLLHAAAERVLAGSRSAVVIDGDAGIGKSSLVAEFLADLERPVADRWQVVHVQFAEPDTERPLVSVIDGLQTLIRNLQSSNVAVPAELFDAVDRFRNSSRVDRTDDTQSGERIVSLVVDGLSELGERWPLLVAFDDVQWIDDVSARVLWNLARSQREGKLLLLACARPTSRESVVTLRRALDALGVVTATLSPLSKEDSETLALRSVEMVGANIRDLLRDAGGNPFFITELLRGLDVVRGLEFEGGSDAIPSSLRRIVMGRLLALPETSMNLLLDAALLGESFEVTDLCLVHSLDAAEVVFQLDVALKEQILVGTGDRLRFRHALVQTIVAESRADPIRRVRHREIAERLAQGNRTATQIAEHHWKSHPYQSDRARACLRQASKEVRTLSLDSALVWAERAHGCANDRAEQFVDQLDIAELLLLRGNLTEAETICRSAGLSPANIAEEQRLRTVLLALTTMAGRTRHSEALEHVEWILAQYGEGEPMWVELMSSKAALLLMSGELARSIEIAHEALAKNPAANPAFVASRTFECLGLNAMLLGHVGESLAFTQRAMDTFDFQRNLMSEVMTPHFGRSLTMLSSRPIQEIEATLQAGIRECDRTGHGLARLHLEPFHALTHFVRGDLSTAQACVDSILSRNSDWRVTDPATDPVDRLNGNRQGRRASDRVLTTPAGRRAGGGGTADGVSLPTVTGLAAYLALMQDDISTAVELADRTIQELLEGGAQAATADFAVWCAASVYEANDDATKARDLLMMIWELMAKEASLYTIAPDVVRLTVDSHPDVAAEVVALADARFERSGAPLDRAHALACRGFFERDAKRLKQAAEAWESLGWLLPPTRIREFALRFSGDDSNTKDTADLELIRSHWTRMEAIRPLRILDAIHPRVTHRGRKPKERTHTLSQTERMVALLVAEGLTNKEIAERLFISYRTVDSHVSHSLSKLGFNSRVQLAGFAVSEL